MYTACMVMQAQPDPQLDVEGRISPFMVGSLDWLQQTTYTCTNT